MAHARTLRAQPAPGALDGRPGAPLPQWALTAMLTVALYAGLLIGQMLQS